MPKQSLWQVAVFAPIDQLLTYQWDEQDSSADLTGHLCQVPLGKRKSQGLIVGRAEKVDTAFATKNILVVDPHFPPLRAEFLNWLKWLSDYYLYPPGLVVQASIPRLNKKGRKTSDQIDAQIFTQTVQGQPPQLNAAQKEVLTRLLEKIGAGFSTQLLYGVTGAGKTEVYCELFHQALSQGGQGLFLLPEISLTPQMIQRFSRYFPAGSIGVLHSQLTDRERTQQWWDLQEGKKKLLIGARSALFCPLPELRLIVVDEEHEASFKQDEKFTYNGRDAAIMLAKQLKIPILLGSATPSLETWRQVQKGAYQLHRLQSRATARPMPTIEMVDLRATKPVAQGTQWLSEPLFDLLTATYARKEQAALFLNRRGSAPLVVCQNCGHIPECLNCDIKLTHHNPNHLLCHYCGYAETYQIECPKCHAGEMRLSGLGTELIEQDLKRIFPNAVVARADRDEISNRDQLVNLITEMETGKIDFLVGTQMIAKGLDFPRLTLIGVVLADLSLQLPDFRAGERSFQMLTQVAGRAGRHGAPEDPPGRVVIQTYNPEHTALNFVQAADFEGFALSELTDREGLGYPPFGYLALVKVQSLHKDRAEKSAGEWVTMAQKILRSWPQAFSGLEVLGPVQAPIFRLRNQYRFQILLKAPTRKQLSQLLHNMQERFAVIAGTRLRVDVDPSQFLV